MAILLLVGSCGCGNKTRVPTVNVVKWSSKHDRGSATAFESHYPKDEWIAVTHPPPAALPEVVPDAPDDHAVWLDGYWRWRGSQWVWMRGGWVHVADGNQLRRSAFWFTQEGGMRFVDRAFVDASGRSVETPEIIRAAATPPIPRLAEESTLP